MTRPAVSQAVSEEPKPSRILTIRKGKMVKPDRIVMTGTEGVGKSTFGASSPNPIFLSHEDGIKHLDVQSFPDLETLEDVHQAIRDLLTTDHDRKTAVVDTVDWLEPILWASLCKRNNWKHIEDAGYGKGYTIVLDEWRKFLADLDLLRNERGMEIILISHTKIANFSNPSGPDYSRYEMSVNKQAAALLKQWADSVLFACYEEMVTKEKGDMKAKGRETGARVIHTERRAAWDAKNRYGLPAVLPLSYEEYAYHRDGGAAVATLAANLTALLDELNPDKALRGKIADFVGDCTDPNKLAQAINRVRALLQEKKP